MKTLCFFLAITFVAWLMLLCLILPDHEEPSIFGGQVSDTRGVLPNIIK